MVNLIMAITLNMQTNKSMQRMHAGITPAGSDIPKQLAERPNPGHKLKFTFVGEDPPVLERIDFTQEGATEPNFLDREHKTHPLRWTKVTKALTLLFLEYAAWGKAGKKGKCFFSGKSRGSLAASLGDAIYKNTDDEFIHSLFTYVNSRTMDFSLVKQVFMCDRGYNVHGKEKDGRNRRIRVNETTLPPESVHISWHHEDSERATPVEDLKQLRGFVNTLRKILGEPSKKWPVTRRIITSAHSNRKKNEDKYADAIRNRFGRLPVDILTPTGVFNHELSLARIYVPQNVRDCQGLHPNLLELSKEYFQTLLDHEVSKTDATLNSIDAARLRYIEQENQNVIDVIADRNNQRMVILGSLGAGKSSLIQFLALRWAEASYTKRRSLHLPLIIELRSYAEARRNDTNIRSFLDFLSHGSGMFWHLCEEELTKQMVAGEVMVCFDGLDEILDSAMREEVVTSILRLTTEFPTIRIVVTSRLSGYRELGLRRSGFKHFNLEDFDDNQISVFIEKWHNEINLGNKSNQLRSEAAIFKQYIFQSNALRDLATNPQLLSIMLMLRCDETLPNTRLELFEQCSQMLLERWKVNEALGADPDLAQYSKALGIREKTIILRHIARQMATDSGATANSISGIELESIIVKSIKGFVHANHLSVARAVIRQLRERNGILRMNGNDHFAFIHRGFLDFYCADDLRQRFVIEKSICEDDLRTIYVKSCSDDSAWRRIFCLFCGMLDPVLVGPLLNTLIDCCADFHTDPNPILLGAECFNEVKHREMVSSSFSIRIKEELISLSCCDCRKSEMSDIMRSTSLEIVNYVKHASPSRVGALRWNAARATKLLGMLFGHEEAIAACLMNVALTSEDWLTQTVAIIMMAQQGSNRPKTREWLNAIAEHSICRENRCTAITEMAHYWQDSTNLCFLQQRSVCDIARKVRETAVLQIASQWSNDKAVLRWLKEIVSTAERSDVHTEAIRGIARHFHTNKAVLSWLKRIVHTHQNDHVRSTATEEIANSWKGRTELFNWFKTLVRRSPYPESVRAAAVAALGQCWGKTASVQSLCDSLVRNDKDGRVRREALFRLDKQWKRDPNNLILLKSLANSDPFYGVTLEAMTALAENWSHDPGTSQILEAKCYSRFLGSLSMVSEPQLLAALGLKTLTRRTTYKRVDGTLNIFPAVKSMNLIGEKLKVEFMTENSARPYD